MRMLFPAHAGVIPLAKLFHVKFKPLPRTCGGDPEVHQYENYDNISSPHMRG